MNKIAIPSGEALALKALSVAQGYADAHIQEQGGNNRGPVIKQESCEVSLCNS